MATETELLERFHSVLVDEIRANRPELLTSPFTVAEIYQELVPYRTHRDRLGVEMNGDYEHLLVRLLAGEGEYLVLDADQAREELRAELASPNPNTGLFREYAAADVRLNAALMSGGEEGGGAGKAAEPVETPAPAEPAPAGLPEPAVPPGGGDESPGGSTPEGDAPAAPAAATEAPGGEAESVACRWCRGPLPDREKLNYCPFCGTDVNVVPCPSCGEALEPEWRFCIACGAGVASD